MTIEQEILSIEALAMLLAENPIFICEQALKLRKLMPDVEFYTNRRNPRK